MEKFLKSFRQQLTVTPDEIAKFQETDMKSGATLMYELWSTCSGVFTADGFIVFMAHVTRSFAGLGSYNKEQLDFSHEAATGSKAYRRLESFFAKCEGKDYLTGDTKKSLDSNKQAFLQALAKEMCRDGSMPSTLFGPALMYFLAVGDSSKPVYCGKHLVETTSFEDAYKSLPEDPLSFLVLLKVVARVFKCPARMSKEVAAAAEKKEKQLMEDKLVETEGGTRKPARKAPALVVGDGLVSGYQSKTAPWKFNP